MAQPTPSTHDRAAPRSAPHSVLAGGERIAQAQLRTGWMRPEIQRALFAARQRFGHALCECQPAPLKLQIRLREHKCHLAVWPQEGPAHDSECLFFHDEVAQKGAAAEPFCAPFAGAEASPTHPDALPVAGRRVALWTGAAAAGEASVSPVSVRSLAGRLWEAASLCRWHPSWIRDWGRTRYQLREAATRFSINGRPLEQLLFVPRPFRQGLVTALNQEWQAFVDSLRAQPQNSPRLLIAPVRRITAARQGRPATAILRHLHDGIGLTPACFDFISRDCRSALANSRACVGLQVRAGASADGPQVRLPELVGFFFVDAGSRGGIWARAGWLMAVHPSTYIPAASSDAVMLVDALLSGGYAFQRLVSEAPPSRRAAPDWLVRHVRGPDGVPVTRAALEIMARSVPEGYRALRHGLAARMAEQGIPTWVWTPGGTGNHPQRRVPQLPPPGRMPVDEATQVLKAICSCADADYRYGPSSKFASPKAPQSEHRPVTGFPG